MHLNDSQYYDGHKNLLPQDAARLTAIVMEIESSLFIDSARNRTKNSHPKHEINFSKHARPIKSTQTCLSIDAHGEGGVFVCICSDHPHLRPN